MKQKIILGILLAILILTASGQHGELPAASHSLLDFFENLQDSEISREDLLNERYYSMVDQNGREIMVTGRKIHVGDEYIAGDNKLYRVYRVKDYVAECRYVREVGAVFDESPRGFAAFVQKYLTGPDKAVQGENGEEEEPEEDLEPQAEPKRVVGVYHTHNAESYVPTDGTDSIDGAGGIHNVGGSFTNALEEKGVTVLHDETLHLPHDRGAYRRSRVTAEKLLQKGPDVIFDVHRDAGPASSYAAEIEDEWVTQVQLVVGRQNPNMQTLRQFALDLKNTADEIHPNLVKGIFMAHGNYNQDLTPTSMLIEVGTHLNSRPAAQDGAALFADVVSYYFYGSVDPDDEQAAPAPGRTQANRGPGGGGTPAGGGVNLTAARNAFWMLTLTAVIAVAFFFINTPLGTIRAKLEPWFAKTMPYTEKADLALEAVQEKIRTGALFAAAKTVVFIQHGDDFLEPVSFRIKEIYDVIIVKTAALLNSGDFILAYWRERIENYALTLKEKAARLRDRDKLK